MGEEINHKSENGKFQLAVKVYWVVAIVVLASTMVTETASAQQQLSLNVTWNVQQLPMTVNGWTGSLNMTVNDSNWSYSGTLINPGNSGNGGPSCQTVRTESGQGQMNIPSLPTPPAPFSFDVAGSGTWLNTDCNGSSFGGSNGGTPTVTILATPAPGGYTLSTNTTYPPNTYYGNSQVTVTASGFLTPPPPPPPKPPTLFLVFGNQQSGSVNSTLLTPLYAEAIDSSFNGVAGVNITFAVTQQPSGANATLTNTTTTTGASGIVNTQLKFGSLPGTYKVTATCTTCSPTAVTFTETATFSYIALGDSFSSGEGVSPFIKPSDTDLCHRSVNAYSTLVQLPGTSSPIATSKAQFDFVACSGAETINVTATGVGFKGEPKQLSAVNKVDSTRDLVTITIGGNDMGFSAILKYCFMHPDCNQVRPFGFYSDLTPVEVFPLKLPFVKGSLMSLYTEIRNDAQNAMVSVLEYPILIEGQQCQYGADVFSMLGSLNVQLNQAIQDAAAQIGVHFIPVANLFSGHGISCTPGGDRWINAVVNPIVGSFHPNDIGQRMNAQAINTYIAQHMTGWAYGYLPNGLPRNPPPAQAPAAMTFSLSTGNGIPEFGDLQVVLQSSPPGCPVVSDLIVPGTSYIVSGAGFAPSESVTLSMVLANEQVVSLGNYGVDPSGNLSSAIMIPASIPIGSTATIEALGAGSQGAGRLLVSLTESMASVTDACNTMAEKRRRGQVTSQ
jgi:lysophospholipase L1-like esterase